MGKYIFLLVCVIGILLEIFNVTNLTRYLFNTSTTITFTPEELQKYNGFAKPELYISILGSIFDVTRGKKHYGPGATYNIFVGRDASRSFITGKFGKKDASDDVKGLTGQELLSLKDWFKFYEKEYTEIGKLIGRFYDKYGQPTEYYDDIKRLIDIAENEKQNLEMEKLEFPPCNVEWKAETGSRVWCSKRSGGIERNWIGVPRKLFEPGSDSYRCACINEEHTNLGNIQEYEDCESNHVSCFVKS